MSKEPLFEFEYKDNGANKTLFLFHGTGGGKSDLLFLNNDVKQKYNLVGLQGNVVEQGMRRFFKRFSEGVFDQESIKVETHKLNQFLNDWLSSHQHSLDEIAFVGYSNGANMILALLFSFPEMVKKAALLHPMLPFTPEHQLNLSQVDLLVTHGEDDPMISDTAQMALTEVLQKYQARLNIRNYDLGHRIGHTEVEDLIHFLMN